MATRQQTVTGNNGAVATTTVAATLAASQQGSLLIAAITVGASAGVITPPSGWVRIGPANGTNPSGGIVVLYKNENNPGGITTVTFTIPSSLASIVISEYLGIPNSQSTALDGSGSSANSNGTTCNGNSAPIVVLEQADLVVWAIGLLATAAPTLSNVPAGFSTDGSAITTAGSGNAVVFLLSNLSVGQAPIPVLSCTLSATPTNGPTCVVGAFFTFLLLVSNLMPGPVVQAQGVYL